MDINTRTQCRLYHSLMEYHSNAHSNTNARTQVLQRSRTRAFRCLMEENLQFMRISRVTRTTVLASTRSVMWEGLHQSLMNVVDTSVLSMMTIRIVSCTTTTPPRTHLTILHVKDLRCKNVNPHSTELRSVDLDAEVTISVFSPALRSRVSRHTLQSGIRLGLIRTL